MANDKAILVYATVVNGWIQGCYELIKEIALTGLALDSPEPTYVEDIEESKNKREISVRVDFLDDSMEIGRVILTRISQEKTHIQVLRDPLPDNRMIMYDLRGQNGDLKKRFEKIRETAPKSLAVLVETIKHKLGQLGLLSDAE